MALRSLAVLLSLFLHIFKKPDLEYILNMNDNVPPSVISGYCNGNKDQKQRMPSYLTGDGSTEPCKSIDSPLTFCPVTTTTNP